MSNYSGENWTLESPVYVSIEVIEPVPKHGKKQSKKKVKKVPFGFSRALPKQTKRKR
jgi:hypothetical protein